MRLGDARIRWALVGLLAVLWATATWTDYRGGDSLQWLGWDYRLYVDNSRAFSSGDPEAIYDPGESMGPGLEIPEVPYPPVFAWLVTPFTALPFSLGYVVWSALNLLAALHLARRAAEQFPRPQRVWAGLAVLLSFPVAFTLITGQTQVWLACALGECYLALRSGRDFRAGLWLAALLLKPQYGILLGLVLVWKRRWSAVLGAGVACLAIVGLSGGVAGLKALRAWPLNVASMATPDPGSIRQVNWRQIVWGIDPSINPDLALALIGVLSVLTLVGVLLVWRGAWEPQEPRFSARVCLLLLASQLVIYHSHNYGLAILAVPLASLFANAQKNPVIRWTVAALVVGPTLAAIRPSGLHVHAASILMMLLLTCCYAGVLACTWRLGPLSRSSPSTQPGTV
jgi:Glycosyltransferase family 87